MRYIVLTLCGSVCGILVSQALLPGGVLADVLTRNQQNENVVTARDLIQFRGDIVSHDIEENSFILQMVSWAPRERTHAIYVTYDKNTKWFLSLLETSNEMLVGNKIEAAKPDMLSKGQSVYIIRDTTRPYELHAAKVTILETYGD